ncbi:MAG: topology modulation protein, partial [Clostridia bacterium]|nr:topology modulation protein [Clostridia bacterium]
MDFNCKRILIVGCGGAGKSTLARQLGSKLDLPVVHLDKLWWLPEWQNRSKEEFDVLLKKELEKPFWIIDGNYRRTFEQRLKYADYCIFLDYPTSLCIESVYNRVQEYRGKTRPDMTDGCQERIDSEFEEWIMNFENSVRPEMLEILQNENVPFIIFKPREST